MMKKLVYILFGAILSALGFAGCDGGSSEGTEEYGTPSCNFNCDITVTDENGKPIQGIKVCAIEKDGFSPGEYMLHDTLTTDANGKVAKDYKGMFPIQKYIVAFEDVDEDANGGTFAKDTAEFEIKKTGKGDGHWFSGTFEAKGTKALKKAR